MKPVTGRLVVEWVLISGSEINEGFDDELISCFK